MKLEGIKLGSVLAIDKAYSNGVILHVVERMTNTQAITKEGTRVALKDGKVIGTSGYAVRFARIPTENDVLAYKIDSATAKLRKFVVTANNIERVEAFLKGNQS